MPARQDAVPHEIGKESVQPPGPVSAPPGTAQVRTNAGSLRREVRKMGYEEGASRLRPGANAQPPPPKGSATVVAAAGPREWSFDGSFSPALLEAMQRNPGRPLQDVLLDMALLELPAGNEDQRAHHPEAASVGQTGAGSQSFPAGRRRAALVANENYQAEPKLDAPAREAGQFHNELVGRGFQVETAGDRTAPQMQLEYERLVSEAEPGDELMGYFSGHGAPEGLVGAPARRPGRTGRPRHRRRAGA